MSEAAPALFHIGCHPAQPAGQTQISAGRVRATATVRPFGYEQDATEIPSVFLPLCLQTSGGNAWHRQVILRFSRRSPTTEC